MRVRWWHVPRGFWLAAILAVVLAAGTASHAAEAEVDDYDAEVCLELAEMYAERGEYVEALKWFDRGLALKAENLNLPFIDGKEEVLDIIGRFGEVHGSYDYIEIGRGCLKLGQYEEALKWYDRGLALEPEGVFYSMQLEGKAEALRGLGRLEEALACYDRALELWPDDSSSYEEKGDILVELGRLEEAIESYDQALEFIDDEYSYLRGYVYEKKIKALKELGTLQEALEGCDEALARDPGGKDLYRYKVRVLMELGRYEEVRRSLARAAEMGLEDADWYVERGRESLLENLLEGGEYEKAVVYFDAALALDPDHAGALNKKGWALTLMGKYDEALECYDRALALDADNPDAWVDKGKTLLLRGDAGAARECFDRALAQEPSLPVALILKGMTYFAEARYDEARPYFEELSSAGGPSYSLLYLYLIDRAEGRPGTDRLQPLLEYPSDIWAKDVSLFLAGRISAEDLLTKAAADKTLLCEGHCYIGYKYKFDGDAAAARRHFEEAVATEAPRPLEYILAQYELRRLEAAGE